MKDKILFKPRCGIKISLNVDRIVNVESIGFIRGKERWIAKLSRNSPKRSIISINVGDQSDEPFFNIDFDIKLTRDPVSNYANIIIYNLSESIRDLIQEDSIGEKIEFFAGYEPFGNYEYENFIYQGIVKKVFSSGSGSEWTTTLECVSEDDEDKLFFSKTFNQNTYYKKIIEEICQRFNIPFIVGGALDGIRNSITGRDKIDFDLSLYGSLKYCLTYICEQVNHTWSIQNGVLKVYEKDYEYVWFEKPIITFTTHEKNIGIDSDAIIFSLSKIKKDIEPNEVDQAKFDLREKEISKQESVEEKKILRQEKLERISAEEAQIRKKRRENERKRKKDSRTEKFNKTFEKNYFELEVPILSELKINDKIKILQSKRILIERGGGEISEFEEKKEFSVPIEEIEFFGNNYGGDFIARLLCPLED